MNKEKSIKNDKFFDYFDPANEISINDLIWEIDNSSDFRLFEIVNENENPSLKQREKNIIIKIYQK